MKIPEPDSISYEDSSRQNFLPGKCVDPETGKLITNPETSVIFEPIRVMKGAVVRSLNGEAFQIHYYSERIRDELIHTYTYDEESVYTYYLPDKSTDPFSSGPVMIREDGFIRIVLEGRTNADFTEKIRISENPPIQFTLTEEQAVLHRKITDAVEQRREKSDALFLLLTDTHYGTGSNFEQTAFLLENIANDLSPDMLIHLGDLTDGSLPREWTKKYALRVIRSLKKICDPCFILIGNHDYNYFRNNPDRFTQKECEELYLDGHSENRIFDLKDKQIRLIFLNSFDPEAEHRYGFSMSTIVFLIKALAASPKSYRIIVLSHVPPLGEIHYWDRNIRHSNLIISVLECFRKTRNNGLVYIHGHNHCDQIYLDKSFPIIGIGPSKVEDFQDKKPEGSVTPFRDQYGGSSVLFDIMLVKEKELLFFRYGTGEDRSVCLK